MKGDFTRFSFDPTKQYTRVLKQQGRVDLDADWNEAGDIQARLDRTRTNDVIGRCGVPKKNAGFMVGVTPDGSDLTLSSGGASPSGGRIYVNGILCQMGQASYNNQPHLPNPPALSPENDRTDLVYLDVWQRHITAIEDPELLEKALGGADTTTRLQAVWQVKVRTSVEETECEGEFEPWPPVPPLKERGRLTTSAVATSDPADPCLIAPGGGYRGLENRLYRVEIHDGGRPYAWPRPAGVGATAVTGIANGNEVTVSDWNVGRRDWGVGQMVELYSDETDAGGQAGELLRVTAVDAGSSTLTVDADVSSMSGHTNLRLRRVATFKWSQDNGSVVFAIKQFEPGEPTKIRVKRLGRDQVLTLHSDDWVEVLGDETELKGLPGTLTAIAPDGIDQADLVLTLGVDVSGHDGESAPKVRRWDQKGAAIAVTTETLDLEDGIQIHFSGQPLITGDYWSFAARTAAGEVEILTDAPPRGIEHSFCRLALVTWQEVDEEWDSSTIEDCRPDFPTLTEICAEDVCYDDSNCEAIEAETVQEALDQLCAQRDLRYHNKHLHGWGIVCGLQVECGEDDPEETGDRTTVIVRPGYALDCEGNDIVLEETMTAPIMEMIAEWEEAHPNEPLLEERDNGRAGAVCLIIERDEHGQPRVALRPYDPAYETLWPRLEDTLLMDFFQDCILEPFEDLRDLIASFAGEGGEDLLVKPRIRVILTILHLLIQLWFQEHGRHVYLSRKEHRILRDLYVALREILHSKTFCAQFDTHPFPAYPFEEAKMSTIFGLSPLIRLRVHPEGQYGYGLGGDNKIYVYDLVEEELMAILEMPVGEGAVVQDVAFSAEGDQLYAIASVQEEDSIFAAAEIDGLEHRWRPVTIVCDVVLKTLARPARFENQLLATGQGEEGGLFLIEKLDGDQASISLVDQFNAVGHLVLDDQAERAYATAADLKDPIGDTYDRVLEFDTSSLVKTFTYFLEAGDLQYTGEDDIAIVPAGQLGDLSKLYVVVDRPDGAGKELMIFQAQQAQPTQLLSMPNTALRLGYIPGSNYLMITVMDNFVVQLVNVVVDSRVDDYELPVQVAPICIAVDPQAEWVYIGHGLSPTITKVSAEHLDPSNPVVDSEPPPGSQEFMDQLIAYRSEVILAFVSLLGGILQYLKDCFCHHLLVNCPECEQDDEIYLGCVEIREDEAYKICNFARRKYVKSFPTMGYWLSLIPITPLVDWAVEYLCCMVLPNIFEGFQLGRIAVLPQATMWGMHQGWAAYQQGAVINRLRERFSVVQMASNVSGDWLGSVVGNLFSQPKRREERPVAPTEVVEQPVNEVLERAKELNVTVERVEAFDATKVTKNLRAVSEMPAAFAPGERIVLYERDGLVRYYARVEEPSEPIRAVHQEMEAQKATLAEVGTLKTTLAEVQDQLASKDQDLLALRAQLQTLEQKQASLEATAAPAKVAEMEVELQELRSFRDEVRRFMARSDE